MLTVRMYVKIRMYVMNLRFLLCTVFVIVSTIVLMMFIVSTRKHGWNLANKLEIGIIQDFPLIPSYRTWYIPDFPNFSGLGDDIHRRFSFDPTYKPNLIDCLSTDGFQSTYRNHNS